MTPTSVRTSVSSTIIFASPTSLHRLSPGRWIKTSFRTQQPHGSSVECRRSAIIPSITPSAAAAGTTAASPALDLTEDQEFVRLPIQSTLLLGLQGRSVFTDSEVNSAYDDLIAAPMEDGYSEAVLAGRQDLLNAVREQIISLKGASKEASAVIPMAMLPSALVILVEVGQYELVLSYGPQLLANWELRKEFKRDVLLTLALAHCGLASEMLAETKQVAEACVQMEQALQLLQEAGSPALAPGLTKDILQGVDNLKGPRTLDELKQPLPTDSAGIQARMRTVATLGGLLSSSGKGEQESPVNADYARLALSCLTSDEAVRVQNWELVARSGGEVPWCTPELVAKAAVAHIVTGFVQHQPSLVKTASNMLKQLPPTADVCVARGVCEVLLGSVDSALELTYQAEGAEPNASLGLEAYQAPPASYRASSSGSAVPRPQQALTFIESHSPREDDLLPGLCLYVQLWLSKVAFPMYRNTSEQPPDPSLVPYFEDTRVEALLTLYEEGGDQGAVAERLNTAFDKIQKALASLPFGSTPTAPDAAGGPNKLLVFGLGAALLAGLAVAFMRRERPPPQTQSPPAVSVASSTAASAKLVSPASQLQPSTAQGLIRRWQDAKAAALGPNYDTSRLPSVLAEPLLGQTLHQVKRFKEQGWFMRYKVSRLKVVEVDEAQLAAGGGATVVASIEESATMFGVDGRQADSYSSVYDTEYRVQRSEDGGWVISQLKVLGREPAVRHP